MVCSEANEYMIDPLGAPYFRVFFLRNGMMLRHQQDTSSHDAAKLAGRWVIFDAGFSTNEVLLAVVSAHVLNDDRFAAPRMPRNALFKHCDNNIAATVVTVVGITLRATVGDAKPQLKRTL